MTDGPTWPIHHSRPTGLVFSAVLALGWLEAGLHSTAMAAPTAEDSLSAASLRVGKTEKALSAGARPLQIT